MDQVTTEQYLTYPLNYLTFCDFFDAASLSGVISDPISAITFAYPAGHWAPAELLLSTLVSVSFVLYKSTVQDRLDTYPTIH